MSAIQTPANRFLDLLPQIFRIRDRDEALRIAALQGFTPPDELADEAAGPLASLLAVFAIQLELLEAEVDWLYEDQFIETCADWAIPYIGALVGARIIDTGDARANRSQVANTIRNRRAKGTARALADRAGAVMGRSAEAVEYAAHVAHTFNLNFPGNGAAVTAVITGKDGRALGLPWTIGQRLAEVRDMREGGRFAPQNVGARIFPIQVFDHRDVVPSAADTSKRRFRFNPVGRDIALFTRGEDRAEGQARFPAGATPGPIPLIAAVDDAGDYYGDREDLKINVLGIGQNLADICFCDLSDDPATGTWNEQGRPEEKTRIRIDPRLGRFILPSGTTAKETDIEVRYRFGAVFGAGGPGRTDQVEQEEGILRDLLGNRDRRPDELISFAQPRIIDPPITTSTAALKTALDTANEKPAIRLRVGGTTDGPASTALPGFTNMEVRGGDGLWPTLMLPSGWSLSAGSGSVLTIRGLRLAGGDLRILSDGLLQLTLIDCTVVPGSARIIIEEPDCKLLAVRSILGEVRVAAPIEIDLVDCILDSADPDSPAIVGLDGSTPAGILWTERSTILGDLRLLSIDEVSSSLLAERPGRTNTGPALTVERQQSGCVRYSALPKGAITPRRYRCFPGPGDPPGIEPVFYSFDYGDAAYAALVPANPEALLLGAESGGEMGIGNSTSLQRRKKLLDADLTDWVPFGMSAAAELAIE